MSRIDKFIWSVRLFKTRSIAADAVKKGRVLINDQDIKTSKAVKVNDIITIKKSGIQFLYKVLALNEKRVGPKLVEHYIEDITPIEAVEKYKTIQANQQYYRHQGSGRPTKKDRRDIDDFWN
ncbi:MAG: RNA-binding S4 domain-containing protein [Putridiphycobacter sp.]|nr:RNA-binding S4 domain-containing protein [Putridiphycobacter sp.]